MESNIKPNVKKPPKVTEVSCKIPSGNDSELDAKVCYMPNPNDYSRIGIIVTHPYALLGGDLHNNVVIGLCKQLSSYGYTTVRFNFRGVGKSSGRGTWRGAAEREDVLAVCNYLLNDDNAPCPNVESIITVGYSYGSVIASSVVNDDPNIIGNVAVSYPFGVLFWLFLSHLLEKCKSSKPTLFIMGSSDNFTGLKNFESKYEAIAASGPADKLIVQGMDHFWFEKEAELADHVKKWIDEKILKLVNK